MNCKTNNLYNTNKQRNGINTPDEQKYNNGDLDLVIKLRKKNYRQLRVNSQILPLSLAGCCKHFTDQVPLNRFSSSSREPAQHSILSNRSVTAAAEASSTNSYCFVFVLLAAGSFYTPVVTPPTSERCKTRNGIYTTRSCLLRYLPTTVDDAAPEIDDAFASSQQNSRYLPKRH